MAAHDSAQCGELQRSFRSDTGDPQFTQSLLYSRSKKDKYVLVPRIYLIRSAVLYPYTSNEILINVVLGRVLYQETAACERIVRQAGAC